MKKRATKGKRVKSKFKEANKPKVEEGENLTASFGEVMTRILRVPPPEKKK